MRTFPVADLHDVRGYAPNVALEYVPPSVLRGSADCCTASSYASVAERRWSSRAFMIEGAHSPAMVDWDQLRGHGLNADVIGLRSGNSAPTSSSRVGGATWSIRHEIGGRRSWRRTPSTPPWFG